MTQLVNKRDLNKFLLIGLSLLDYYILENYVLMENILFFSLLEERYTNAFGKYE